MTSARLVTRTVKMPPPMTMDESFGGIGGPRVDLPKASLLLRGRSPYTRC